MDLADFGRRFVETFDSARRRKIFAILEEFYADLHLKGLSGELWLDGSFLTEKNDPHDLDGVLVIHHELYDSFSSIAQSFADDLVATDSKIQDVLDMFCTIYYPSDDVRSMLDPIDDWVKLYGSQNDQRWLKGFAVIRVGLCDVGF